METEDDAVLKAADNVAAEAWTYWEKGQGMTALALYRRAHDLVRAQAGISIAQKNRFGANHAHVLAMTGNAADAIVLWEDLLAEAHAHNLPTDIIIRQKAVAHERNRDLDRAACLLDQITPTAQASDDDRLKWHNAYGIIDWRRGRMAAAQAHFRIAIDALPTTPETARLVLACLSNAAVLEYELGRINAGHRYAEYMQSMAGDLQTFSTTCGLMRLKAIHSQMYGDPADAAALWLDAYRLILDQTPDDIEYQFEFAVLAANLWRQCGETEKARELLQDVLARCPPDREYLATSALTLQADLHLDAGEVAAATAILDRVTKTEAGRNDVEREVPLLASLARVADHASSLDAAILLGKMALAARLKCAASLGFDNVAAVLVQTNDAALRLTDQLNRAGRFAEAAVTRRLYSRTAGGVPLQRHVQTSDLGFMVPFRDSEALAARDWQAVTAPLASDLSPNSKTPRAAAPAISDIIHFRDPQSAADAAPVLQPILDADVLQISYSVGRDNLGFTALRGATLRQGVLAPTPPRLAATIAQLRDTMDSLDGWDHHARRVFDWLIGPFTDLLDGARRIEIAPSGVLENLPFACLLGPRGFLCEHAPIVILRDADSSGTSAAPAQHPTHLIAFGGDHDAHVLDAARHEVADIAATAPIATQVTGTDCTRASLARHLAAAPSHVHFAGHFNLVPTRPSASTLQLGDGSLLYLTELAGPEFSMEGVELACFAACETGLTDRGETGFESLAQVVLDQGARNVIATLWPVADTHAHVLMVAFYTRLFGVAEGCVATALNSVQRQAAAQLRRTFSDGSDHNRIGGIGGTTPAAPPKDWAGFVHYKSAPARFDQRNPAKPPNTGNTGNT